MENSKNIKSPNNSHLSTRKILKNIQLNEQAKYKYTLSEISSFMKTDFSNE